jgi:hypothetical protein
MSAVTLEEPKKTPFTVGDIKPIIDLVNCNVLVTECNPFSSKVLTIDNLAEICILCKFLIQGIRAHGIFKDLSKVGAKITSFFSGDDSIKKIGELKDLYDGLKHSVFNDEKGTFNKSCIENDDTNYNIPPNFLSQKVSRKPNYLNGSVTVSMRSDIQYLITGMYRIFASTESKITSISFTTNFETRRGYNFTGDAFKMARTTLSELITKKCQNENVKNWYIQWSLIFQQLFGEMPFFVTDNTYKSLGKDPFMSISSKTPAYQENTIVGQITQAGGKSRRSRTKRAARGSTKRKQRTHRKKHNKHRKQCKATRHK